MNGLAERRVAPEGGLADKLEWPLRLSRALAWQVVLLGVGLAGLADFASGTELWFGPVYLVFIGLAAWSLGWWQAVTVGFGCLAVTLSVNDFVIYPYAGVTTIWNVAMRVAAVMVLIALLHAVRQMYAREWRLSRTDLLTGALSRKAFFELTGGRTYSRGWSVLAYADLDGFKELNDSSGHAAGDECLQRFVQQVTRVIRADDVLGRLGGDEFAIYLDVRDKAAAKTVAARLHKAMNSVELGGGAKVRCSVGALIMGPGSRSIDREVRRADALMYEAKGLGSSLVAGTLSNMDGNWVVHHHWELTPDAEAVLNNLPSAKPQRQNRLGAREARDKGELLDAA